MRLAPDIELRPFNRCLRWASPRASLPVAQRCPARKRQPKTARSNDVAQPLHERARIEPGRADNLRHRQQRAVAGR